MLKLHHTSGTRSGRVIWLLEELRLPYELNTLNFNPKDLKSDAHRARHPLGRIPVLEDGDVQIFESGAIVEYILARHTDGALKPAVESPEFPYYLQWFHYCEGMVMPPMNTIVVHTRILPEDRRNEVVLGQAQRLLGKALMPINETLAEKEYLIGDFSAADVMLGHSCVMSGKLGVISETMPHLNAYVDRLSARPALITAFAA